MKQLSENLRKRVNEEEGNVYEDKGLDQIGVSMSNKPNVIEIGCRGTSPELQRGNSIKTNSPTNAFKDRR